MRCAAPNSARTDRGGCRVRAGRAMWRTKQKRDLDWKSGWNGLPSALVDSNAVMPFDDWMKIVGHLSDEVEQEGNAIGWEDVSPHSFLCHKIMF